MKSIIIWTLINLALNLITQTSHIDLAYAL